MKIKDFFRVLLTPSCWFQNYKYNEKWNRWINIAIDNFSFSKRSQYTAIICNTVIWVGNHPYASFRPYDESFPTNIRPSRTTILKAYDKYMEDILKTLT